MDQQSTLGTPAAFLPDTSGWKARSPQTKLEMLTLLAFESLLGERPKETVTRMSDKNVQRTLSNLL